MGQRQDNSNLSNPFGLTSGDDLIDDALGCVVEISKLRFPDDQGVGVGHGESSFESEDTVFGQRAVADGVRGLVGVQVVQWSVSCLVDGLMVEHVMSVGEGTTLDVLARKTDVDSFFQERTKGESFTNSPVTFPFGYHVHTGLKNPFNT